MSQLFKFRLALSLALLLLISAAKTSYAYSEENGRYRTERLSQTKIDHHLQNENHAAIALIIQGVAEATPRGWQSIPSGGGASGRFPGARTIRFRNKIDLEFNFIRWHVLHQLIQQSELIGRYPTHSFW